MSRLDNFELWLEENTSLSNSSIEHYKRAVRAVSKDMLEIKVISKDLMDMNLLEFDIAVNNIVVNPEFIFKNRTGNRMYSAGLAHYRYFLLLNSDIGDNVDEEKLIGDVPVTEKEVIAKSRIGQGVYRNKLICKYDGKCIVTGLTHPKLLVASHIKPWSVCSNEERIDESNGLLLSATIDKLFDCGLITFKDNGQMKVSKFVGPDNEHILKIYNGFSVDLKATQALLKYLEYHRDVLFVN